MAIDFNAIDFDAFDPQHLGIEDVRILMKGMYAGDNAKKKAWRVLSQADENFVVKLLDQLSLDEDPDTKCTAVTVLFWLKGANSLPWIERLIEDQNDGIRWAGYRILADTDSPRAVPLLIHCLENDPSGNVRFLAVRALEMKGDSASLPVLRKVAKEDKGTDFEGRPVAERAAEAVERIGRA